MKDEVNEFQRRALVSVVEKHLPSATRSYLGGFAFETVSEFHSDRLLDAFNAPLLPFGLGPSADEWKSVRKAAAELERALKALGQDGMREMNWSAPDWWRNAEKPLGLEAYLTAHVLKEASARMEKKRKQGLKPGKKRNWPAAALAKVAREIWAREEWESKPEHYGPQFYFLLDPSREVEGREGLNALSHTKEYEIHLRSYAPRSDKLDGPGPFGRFLNDILECLSIETRAASALRSLADVEQRLS